MKITVGTFNLNNLFSRYNFKAAIKEIKSSRKATVTVKYEFTDSDEIKIRKFMGKIVTEKKKKERQIIADRIIAINVDVLAVQEVENIEILKDFNREYLRGMYDFQILIEGNDPRFIDVGILSKYPIGSVTSFKHRCMLIDHHKPFLEEIY